MATLLPKQPLLHEDDTGPLVTTDFADTSVSHTEVNVPSETTFAQEVRMDRLALLWKATLFGALLIMWTVIVISGGSGMTATEIIIPAVVIAVGCVLTGRLLQRERFGAAVWSYALGVTVGVGFMMGYGGTFLAEYAAFSYPILLFVVGLLISVRETFTLMGLVYVSAIFFPSAQDGSLTVEGSTLFALTLTTLATALSAQVSGELFAIAEWALENYRKERRTTFALFESREALQKSFLRQTALTRQLQETNRELEISRKAEEEAKHFRGQFLANMSHELRTPLNAIIGFSQTMLDFPAMYDEVELPVQYRQDMNQILGSGKHLLAIINDILDLSKVDAGKLDLEIQPVDLAPIVKGVLSTAVGLVGDNIQHVQLLRDLPEPLPMVDGDPLRVRQVLLNLYSNAAKFTDSGHIKLIVRTEGDEVVFGVEDTGIGIAETDRVTIFEEFRQGTAGRKKGRRGAGLGLAISQQLLRLMDGRLWFESVLGKGSTFYFALPVHVPEEGEQPVAEPETTPARAVAGAGGGEPSATETEDPGAEESVSTAVADVSG